MIHNPLTAERPLYPPSRAAGAPKQIQLNPTITALVLFSEHWKGYTAGAQSDQGQWSTILVLWHFSKNTFCSYTQSHNHAIKSKSCHFSIPMWCTVCACKHESNISATLSKHFPWQVALLGSLPPATWIITHYAHILRCVCWDTQYACIVHIYWYICRMCALEGANVKSKLMF